MADLTNVEIAAIAVVVVLGCVVAGLLLYLLRRLRDRRAKLLGELENRPQLNQDRAFNRLAMARREATILAGQGVDIHRAQELIAEAQGAFDTHQYDHAYRAAQSAHEALVNARQQGSRVVGATPPTSGTATPLPSGPPPSAASTVVLPSGPTASAASTPLPPSGPGLPKNRAESQFQIRLLEEELEALPSRRAKDHAATDAAEFRRQATSAFEKGDYTDAFRLALKGRRALGGSIESLPASNPPTSSEPREAGPAGTDAASTAESVADAQRCPDCGYPALSGDAFCRGCGRPRAPLTCPACGAPRGADESFCGRCGSRFP